MESVPTMHLPYKKALIRKALEDSDFKLSTKTTPEIYFYKC